MKGQPSRELRATLINEDKHIRIRGLQNQCERRWPPINIFAPDQRQAFEPWNWFVKSSIPRGLSPVHENIRRRLSQPTDRPKDKADLF